ncbi:MAG: cob(I)yrinic acid a,c-diamide adenosyltransferase [archaeon]
MRDKITATKVITGKGKGKTTSSIGEIIRALGKGYKIELLFFHKKKEKMSIDNVLKDFDNINMNFFACKHPFFDKNVDNDKIMKECKEGLNYVIEKYDNDKKILFVLDEIFISYKEDYITKKDIINLIKKKVENNGLILTGRGFPKELKKYIDIISVIKNKKYNKNYII